jgi:hypothetical protein
VKTIAIVLGTMVLAAALVVAGFAAGTVWGQGHWDLNTESCAFGESMGPGMMDCGRGL